MAGPATLHERIANEYGASDDLPCADARLLVALKRSREYGLIRRRIADLRPIDSWLEDGLHFFVFQLLALDAWGGELPEAPTAVLTMHPDLDQPVSAVVITPKGQEAEVLDLRQPELVYTAPLTL